MALRFAALAMLVVWSCATARADATSLQLPQPAARRAQHPLEVAPPTRADDPLSRPRTEPWSSRRKLALASWLVGGVLLGASMATGIGTFADMQLFDAQRPENRLSLGMDVLVGVGAAGIVTGTALWLFGSMYSERARTRASLRLKVSAGYISLHGRF
jgi:hypothetical protein